MRLHQNAFALQQDYSTLRLDFVAGYRNKHRLHPDLSASRSLIAFKRGMFLGSIRHLNLFPLVQITS